MRMFPGHWTATTLMALAAVGAGPAAAQLALLNPLVGIEVGNGAAPTVTTDPSFAQNTVLDSFASADFSAGVFKVKAFVPGAPVFDNQLARSSGQFQLRNDGAVSIPLIFKASVIASFDQTLGADPQGYFNEQLNANLSVGQFDVAAIAYNHSGNAVGANLLVNPLDTPPGMTTINTATISALDLTFSDAGFSLAPGATANVFFGMDANVQGALGTSAVINAVGSNGYRISLLLPAGVTLDSPIAVPWVSNVPEPSTYLMMLAGLAGWAALRGRSLPAGGILRGARRRLTSARRPARESSAPSVIAR